MSDNILFKIFHSLVVSTWTTVAYHDLVNFNEEI